MSVKNTDRDLDKLQDNFRKKVDLRLSDNPEIFVTEAYRSQERQEYLYSLWRSIPWSIVTKTTNSNHTKGIAVDVAFTGSELYPRDHDLRRNIADSAKNYGIDWGYDLWGRDKPHFQDNWVPFIEKTRDPLIQEAIDLWYYNGIEGEWLTDRVVLFTMKALWGENMCEKACIHKTNLPIWDFVSRDGSITSINWLKTIKKNKQWFITYSIEDEAEEVAKEKLEIMIRNSFGYYDKFSNGSLKFKQVKKWWKIKIHFARPWDERLPEDFKTQSLAYWVAPSNNRYSWHIYVNEKIDWGKLSQSQNYRLLKVLVHEIGHVLNMAHSSNEHDIMYFSYERWDHDIIFTPWTKDLLNKLY